MSLNRETRSDDQHHRSDSITTKRCPCCNERGKQRQDDDKGVPRVEQLARLRQQHECSEHDRSEKEQHLRRTTRDPRSAKHRSEIGNKRANQNPNSRVSEQSSPRSERKRKRRARMIPLEPRIGADQRRIRRADIKCSQADHRKIAGRLPIERRCLPRKGRNDRSQQRVGQALAPQRKRRRGLDGRVDIFRRFGQVRHGPQPYLSNALRLRD